MGKNRKSYDDIAIVALCDLKNDYKRQCKEIEREREKQLEKQEMLNDIGRYLLLDDMFVLEDLISVAKDPNDLANLWQDDIEKVKNAIDIAIEKLTKIQNDIEEYKEDHPDEDEEDDEDNGDDEDEDDDYPDNEEDY